MALADFIPQGSRVAFDTNSLIYYIERHPEFLPIVQPVFRMLAGGLITGHVSVISLTEVLVLPTRQQDNALADQYRDILYRSPNIALYQLGFGIAEIAAELRARYRLTTPDAIVGATAVYAGCTHFVTNDGRFRAVPNIEVLVIREHAEEKG